jgi:hypothetical protein
MASSEAERQTERRLPAIATRPAELADGPSHCHPMDASAMTLLPQHALLGNRCMWMGGKLRCEGGQISGRDGGRTACWSPGTEMTDRPPLPEVAFNRRDTHAKGPRCLCLGHTSIDRSHDLLASLHGVRHASASLRAPRARNLCPFQTPFRYWVAILPS